MSLENFIRLADGMVVWRSVKRQTNSVDVIICGRHSPRRQNRQTLKPRIRVLMQDRAAKQNYDDDSRRKLTKSIFEEEASEDETFKAKYNSTYLTYCNCLAVLCELYDISFQNRPAVKINPIKIFQTKVKVPNCALCPSEAHIIRKCPNFISMAPRDRSTEIRKQKLCINCFSKSHLLTDYTSKFSCFQCSKGIILFFTLK